MILSTRFNLVGLYRTLQPTSECIFSIACRTFTKIDHIHNVKQVSINLKWLKSYKVCFLTSIELENNNKMISRNSSWYLETK
jgi:hypothetical protein